MTMTNDDLPFKKEGEFLGATHLNALTAVARKFNAMQPGANLPSFDQRVYTVIADKNELTGDELAAWKYTTRYTAKSMYYHKLSDTWEISEREGLFPLDASQFGDTLAIDDVIVAYWDPQRGALIPISPPRPAESEGGGGGSGGSGGCCCDEMNCLRIPGSPAIQVRPAYYEFTPGSLLCGCEPASLAQRTVKLYPVDTEYLIWESRHGEDDLDVPMCLGTTLETQSCTTNARWRWSNEFIDLCPGEGSCTYQSFETFATPPYAWTIQSSGCTGGCSCPYPSTPPVSHPSTTTASCTEGGTSTGGWVLEGLDDPDCVCTPTEPDYTPDWDGTGDAPTAITVCEGTKVTDSSETLLRAFWRLTIVEDLTYFGCDETKLEFIIGEA